MAFSPTPEVFYIYDPATGAPIVGQAIGAGAGQVKFLAYQDDTGAAIVPPAITEVGAGANRKGAYKFTPVFADPLKNIIYIVDTGTTGGVQNFPSHYARRMRPEDYFGDYGYLTWAAVGVGGIVDTLIKRIANLFGLYP